MVDLLVPGNGQGKVGTKYEDVDECRRKREPHDFWNLRHAQRGTVAHASWLKEAAC